MRRCKRFNVGLESFTLSDGSLSVSSCVGSSSSSSIVSPLAKWTTLLCWHTHIFLLSWPQMGFPNTCSYFEGLLCLCLVVLEGWLCEQWRVQGKPFVCLSDNQEVINCQMVVFQHPQKAYHAIDNNIHPIYRYKINTDQLTMSFSERRVITSQPDSRSYLGPRWASSSCFRVRLINSSLRSWSTCHQRELTSCRSSIPQLGPSSLGPGTTSPAGRFVVAPGFPGLRRPRPHAQLATPTLYPHRSGTRLSGRNEARRVLTV